MRIIVEMDEKGNCTKPCPYIKVSKKGVGIPIMVGGGLCVYMCPHFEAIHKGQDITVECNQD